MSNIEIRSTRVTVSVQESMTERDIIIIVLYNIVYYYSQCNTIL